MKHFPFPDDFTWGAATSAYQIEGAVDEDGRGLSTWDVYCEEKGRINNGDSGAVACDHYHLWPRDIQIMKELNLKAYRFSLSWPRILPEGDGRVNKAGIDFYDRLIDALLKENIEPWITLFHWDLPSNLQKRFGGWQSRETVKRFADYARICAEKYGDRVKNWFTINEIICFTGLSHNEDYMAPGGKLPEQEVNQMIHHALIGHAMAVSAIKDTVAEAKVGLVENLVAFWPLYEREDHINAARAAFEDWNSQRLFPAIRACYDEEKYCRTSGAMPRYESTDLDTLSVKMDFIAYNYYFSNPVIAADNEEGYRRVEFPRDYPRTDMNWAISPRGLYWTLRFSKDFFPDLPIYITENGQAAADEEERDGSVLDVGRLEYFRTHLEMASRAIADGVPLKGYFAWSLLDNFEWSYGYAKRFGLTRVNYRTQERTIKSSGRFYADVIANNRVL